MALQAQAELPQPPEEEVAELPDEPPGPTRQEQPETQAVGPVPQAFRQWAPRTSGAEQAQVWALQLAQVARLEPEASQQAARSSASAQPAESRAWAEPEAQPQLPSSA
jgi:hypothetical protein